MLKIRRQFKFKSVIFFLLYFFLFILLLKNSFGYLDPDFGWHLKVGQQITQEHKLPSINTFNYNFTGNWVDHEWFINYLVYLVWNNFGYIMLTVIFSLLIVLIWLLMLKESRFSTPNSPLPLIVFLQIFGLIASLPHFGVRMQEIGLLFLILLLLIIDKYTEKKDWKVLLFLPPLFFLWAFFHASFLIGFFILGLWVLVKGLEIMISHFSFKFYFDLSEKINFQQLAIFFGTSLLSLVATTLTPYGFKLFYFLNSYKDSYYQTHIQEWLPQFYFPFNYYQLGYLVLVSLALIFYIYYSVGNYRMFKINFWKVCLVGCFFVLSFKSRRHFPLLFIVSFAFLVEVYGRISTLLINNTKQKILFGIKILVVLCFILTSVLIILKINYTDNPFLTECNEYPCGATDFLRNREEYKNANLLNEYSWGGYLIWQLPERKLFIDGRLPQIFFAGHTFLEEYNEFFQVKKIAGKLEQYQIKLVLIPAKENEIKIYFWEKIFFNIKDEDLKTVNSLRDYLAASPDWRLIYKDQIAVIYYKK